MRNKLPMGTLVSLSRLEFEMEDKGRIPGVTDMRKYASGNSTKNRYRAMLSERLKDSNKYIGITIGYYPTKREAAEAYYFAYLTKFGVPPFTVKFLKSIK